MAFSAYYAYAGAALLMLELFHFSRQVAEKLWNIAPGHCVFRFQFEVTETDATEYTKELKQKFP